jgi:dephospho-CoA kinase
MYICRFEHSSSAHFLTAHHHARYAHPLASQVLAPTPALVVGLTGGIATGKSTVSARLRGAQIPVVDADVLARDVVAPGTRALAQIERAFGPEVIRATGELDRARLGEIVFKDARARARLNAIVHPAVRRAMFRAVVRHWWAGEPVCVLDVPLLIESGIYRVVGRVVVVYWCAYTPRCRHAR